jgi:hypothetical protein
MICKTISEPYLKIVKITLIQPKCQIAATPQIGQAIPIFEYGTVFNPAEIIMLNIAFNHLYNFTPQLIFKL